MEYNFVYNCFNNKTTPTHIMLYHGLKKEELEKIKLSLTKEEIELVEKNGCYIDLTTNNDVADFKNWKRC